MLYDAFQGLAYSHGLAVDLDTVVICSSLVCASVLGEDDRGDTGATSGLGVGKQNLLDGSNC